MKTKGLWLLVGALAIFNAEAGPIELGPAVTYDRRALSAGEEPGMWCAHPTDPDQLIGITSASATAYPAGNELRQNYVVRRSEDGGQTWVQVLRTSAAPIEIDPACTYGIDGQIFVSAMAYTGTGYSGANLWRSLDGGRSWEPPTRIDHARFFDRPFLTVDRGNTPYRGRLYVVAWGKSLPGDALQRPDEMVVYTSDDGGKTLVPAGLVPTTNDNGRGAVHPGEAVVLPDGTYVISWTEVDMEIDFEKSKRLPSPGVGTVKIARSLDGGQLFEPPIEVAKSQWRMESDGRDVFVSKFYPSLAVDITEGPFSGSLYVAWADASTGRQEIMFSRSSDGGKTWTAPKVLSQGQSFDSANPVRGPHNKMVVVRVDHRGVVGALYYAQDDPDPDVTFRPAFTASLDGGTTWSSPERVLDDATHYNAFNLDWDCPRLSGRAGAAHPIKCTFPARASVPNCLYGLAASTAGGFHAFVFSNPHGRPTFTMRNVTVAGDVMRHEEVDADIHLLVETHSYNTRTQTVWANATILNTSSRELRLPIRLVVDRLDRTLVQQQIEILNADNRRPSAGAWWDFTGRTNNAVLAAGEQSAPRLLKIRFTGTLKTSISSAPRMQLNLRTYEPR